jgi:hypothetical protein
MAESKNDALRIAIGLFRASQEASSALGRPVLAALDDAFKSARISFVSFPLGKNGENTGNTIQMNQLLKDDPATLSVWLVHEAYHVAAKRNELEIDEEIHSRELQGRYWQSLIQGISFEGQTYRVGSGQLLDSYRKDQLVDWVLGMPEYSDKAGFLTQNWIAKHIQDWKGPANRNIFTKRMYVSVLVQRPDMLDIGPVARALFALLKSSTVADARSLISHAGGGNFPKGQAMVKERLSQIWGATATTNEFVDSVLRWQRETGIDLGAVPRR